MRSLAISGVALVAMMASQPAFAEIDSAVGAPPIAIPAAPPIAIPAAPPMAAVPAAPPMAKMPDARAPEMRRDMPPPPAPMATGPNRQLDYPRPAYGFQLPRQWMSPEYVVDHREVGLDRPAAGFGWSRYYDDMVLTDQWGRVYDVARNYGPDDRSGRGNGHGGRRFGSRDTDGLAGGIGGAAAGAVAGNLIAGAGSRLAGSLIGGGVGALAGLAIEAAITKKGHRRDRRADYDESNYRRGASAHWGGGYPAQSWSYGCNCGGDAVTTTTTTYHSGGGVMVPRQVVTYENVYAPVRTKYVARAVAPSKIRVREEAPVAEGKTRVRTKLHTKTY